MPGWPCSEVINTALEAAVDDPNQANLDVLCSALWDELPVIPLGEYWQPIAMRADIDGFLKAANLVFWNLERRCKAS